MTVRITPQMSHSESQAVVVYCLPPDLIIARVYLEINGALLVAFWWHSSVVFAFVHRMPSTGGMVVGAVVAAVVTGKEPSASAPKLDPKL